MPEHHKVLVVRINEILPHTNADTLGLVVPMGSYQCVVKKDEYKVGDLAVFIPPDSVVPQSKPFAFLWADKVFVDNVVPEKYRRITVRRFRKEYSEGLLLPLKDFASAPASSSDINKNSLFWKEGDDVAETLGITHYEEPEPIEPLQKQREQYKKWPPRSLKGFFYWLMAKLGINLNGPLGGSIVKPPKNAPPVYSVESFKNYPRVFQDGEDVVVTEKIHGSNARYTFDGDKMWVGSKNLWKSEKSDCIWRRALKLYPFIETWCRRWPNYVLYGEVVPTQKGYTYGTTDDVPIKFFVFDVLTSEGKYFDKRVFVEGVAEYPEQGEKSIVPILYQGPYDEAKIKTLVEGKSTLGDHLREGIVISSATERHVRGLGRAQLKLKQNKFLEKEREG